MAPLDQMLNRVLSALVGALLGSVLSAALLLVGVEARSVLFLPPVAAGILGLLTGDRGVRLVMSLFRMV